MVRPGAHLAATAALLVLAGCGSSKPAAMPASCLGEPAEIERALQRAPAAVALADGTRLSVCVSAANDDSELASLGVSLTQAADELRERADRDPAAALQLGYLIGAVRRGAAKTTGVAAQLALRVEQSAARDFAAAAPRAALQRGIGLGEAGG